MEHDSDYKEFLQDDGFDEKQAFADYSKACEEEAEKQRINTESVLEKIKPLVNNESYFKAIEAFLADEENGIYGDLKLVYKPIGKWQDEYQDKKDKANYWNVLKGMYINQSCGYSGDDYSGTLEICIDQVTFLRCSFSL